MNARARVRYGLLTALYVAGVYGLSSLPDLAVRRSHAIVLVISNLAHVPVFAGLAYCVLKTLAGRSRASRDQFAAAFAITAALAVFDEFHQAFVPGRSTSVIDLLLDLLGIVGALVMVRLRSVPASRECVAK